MLKSLAFQILKFLKKVLPLVTISRYLSLLSRKISYLAHKLQFIVEWSVDNPEYFDHFIDLNYQWKYNRHSFFVERGVFSSIALKNQAEILDLCCGDGFNSYFFYSIKSKSVIAIDFDREAINWAKKNYKASNLKFIHGDIRYDFPKGNYSNIVWDAAIEHFTQDEISQIMFNIKSNLAPDGILSGYTIKESESGHKHLHQHEYEFHDKEDLARFLTPKFKNVHVFETIFPERTNLYFYATDGKLPFEQNWNLISRQE